MNPPENYMQAKLKNAPWLRMDPMQMAIQVQTSYAISPEGTRWHRLILWQSLSGYPIYFWWEARIDLNKKLWNLPTLKIIKNEEEIQVDSTATILHATKLMDQKPPPSMEDFAQMIVAFHQTQGGTILTPTQEEKGS